MLNKQQKLVRHCAESLFKKFKEDDMFPTILATRRFVNENYSDLDDYVLKIYDYVNAKISKLKKGQQNTWL